MHYGYIGFGVSSFNQGSNGDIPQQIVNNVSENSVKLELLWGI